MRTKAQRKEDRKKIKDKIKGAANKVGYARLIVFKPVMVQALKKKGARVSMSTKMDKLVPMFKDIVIEHKPVLNYEDYENNLDTSEDLEHIYAEASEAVIQLVLNFISNLKAKKDRGEKLSADEQNILEGSEKVADSVKEGAKEYGKNWFFDLWYIWVLVAGLLVYMAVKKK